MWISNTATAIMMLAIGPFAVIEDSLGALPVNYWVYPEAEENARWIFQKTPRMIAFYAELQGGQGPTAALRAARAQVVKAEAAIDAARARVYRIGTDIADSELKSPIRGRVLYRLAEPGEVLPAGGKVFTVLQLTDIYMTIFLPTTSLIMMLISS